jgi:hypothetical protein
MSQSLLTLRQPGVTLMFDFDSPWTETDLQNWHRLIAKFYETFRDDFPMCIPVATSFIVANFLHAEKTKDEFLKFASIAWDLEQSAQQQPLGKN